MPPSQFLTFCCVLISCIGLVVGINSCEEAVESLFNNTEKQSNLLDDPNVTLSDLTYHGSFFTGPGYLSLEFRNQKEAVMTGDVFILIDKAGRFASAAFFFKGSRGGLWEKNYCKLSDCREEIMTLYSFWNPETRKLRCFHEGDWPRTSPDQGYGLDVFFPLTNKRYKVSRADHVVAKLVKAQPELKWDAIRGELDPEEIIFGGIRGTPGVNNPLPLRFNWGVREYIDTAVEIYNYLKKEKIASAAAAPPQNHRMLIRSPSAPRSLYHQNVRGLVRYRSDPRVGGISD